jgi:hypothetical protein
LDGAAAKLHNLNLLQNQQIAKALPEKYHSPSLILVKGPAAAKTGIFPAEGGSEKTRSFCLTA